MSMQASGRVGKQAGRPRASRCLHHLRSPWGAASALQAPCCRLTAALEDARILFNLARSALLSGQFEGSRQDWLAFGSGVQARFPMQVCAELSWRQGECMLAACPLLPAAACCCLPAATCQLLPARWHGIMQSSLHTYLPPSGAPAHSRLLLVSCAIPAAVKGSSKRRWPGIAVQAVQWFGQQGCIRWIGSAGLGSTAQRQREQPSSQTSAAPTTP